MQASIQRPRPLSRDCIIEHRMHRSLPRKRPSSIARRAEGHVASAETASRYVRPALVLGPSLYGGSTGGLAWHTDGGSRRRVGPSRKRTLGAKPLAGAATAIRQPW